MAGAFFRAIVFAGLVGAAALWWITRPAPLPDGPELAQGDAEAGALVFAAAGCASCHVTPGAPGTEQPVLAGGRAFETQFGTFFAPNITLDPEAGIGGWNQAEFAHALREGVSPEGRHYYPAFPYTAYAQMTPGDVADLYAYMQHLPASMEQSKPHDLPFPVSVRRTLGVWKLLGQREDFHLQGDLSPEEMRGRYLAEALGHCSECHTPRNALGVPDRDRWLAGAPSPTGKGKIPNITPGVLDWSEADLVAYFTTGLTPDYDSAGGDMAVVVENLALLPDSDRAALAAYLLRIETVR
ncbi:cytochrome c [Roseobacter ponti]|uniref:C-type cytochrome n=1 Tax=Roseobacter ponti TaxID=1891787 RepID=A0A858SRM0_9RHOB|nr:cytochrome c [Roseobacter ponti]QJF51325.1 c-type cytochrome [Roseobacter ponti]